jgi:hypothetical protein
MKIEQQRWSQTIGWQPQKLTGLKNDAQLVFLFGSSTLIKDPQSFHDAKSSYPNAHIIGCSTAGEICGTQVTDETLVRTAIYFEKTHIKGAKRTIHNMDHSYQIGKELALDLDHHNLNHVFVLSDGIHVNGSELVRGINDQLPSRVTVTGGLSADSNRFQETYVIWDNPGERNTITILGLYGESLKVGYGSLGGWDTFGPERIITKSKKNVLYEMDGQSALELYKKYLGEHAEKLPASALLFPLSVRMPESNEWVVRTILSVNEKDQSMTFAGDIPEKTSAQLMKANFERLIDGAAGAAKGSYEALGSVSPDLAILISCVGRKMVLGPRIEEEVESVRDTLGPRTILTGFYSYGEISPFSPNAKCELHNQTMTITTFHEK